MKIKISHFFVFVLFILCIFSFFESSAVCAGNLYDSQQGSSYVSEEISSKKETVQNKTNELQSADSTQLSEQTETDNASNSSDLTIDANDLEIINDVYSIPEETNEEEYTADNDKSSKTAVDAILSPIGWTIGCVIAPIYMGFDFTGKAIVWSGENIIAPAGKGLAKAAYYASLPVTNSLTWSIDNIVNPTVASICWFSDKTFSYTIVPITRSIFWTLDKCAEYIIDPAYIAMFWTIEKGIDYGLKPAAKSLYWGVGKTYEYVLLPMAKGVYYSADFGYDYVVVPFSKGVYIGAKLIGQPIIKTLWFGAKYTLVPAGKGLALGAKAIGNGRDWGIDNVIQPVGEGIWYGVEKTITPISNAVDTAVDTLMSITDN